MEDLKLAVLIDADNISPKYVKVILDEAASFGVAAAKRIYGDWSDPRLKSWKDALLNNSIIPMQQYSYTTGKNATDSAMIIDAMDLLYSGNLDGFCIVSSDSDFTRLAARLREAGKLVIGMGESKTLGPFVKACDQFKYLDLILDHSDHNEPDTAGARDVTDAAEAAAMAAAGDDTAINRDSVYKLVRGMIDEMDDGTGWVRTSRVGDQLIKRYPDFDVRNFGSKSLNRFLASFPELEVEERILANGNPIQFVRIRPQPKPASKKNPPRKTPSRQTSKKRATHKK
ncbi:NYN domain-containing protein [uncultured Gemmiger sp.]|uniref:NYN domain-containing protein n=1 Tax=uncultured Gemmiger sp. TaxID=1623490 RepID=UPI0025EEDEFC|nr:NYN domain-containing protein [uncultured Gemmiger sp.]